uniref:Uncharacterized protein n=1 Tax=Rhizophora mucronata TaxID=61149 RepID=A0A2P2K9P2_RHIMU
MVEKAINTTINTTKTFIFIASIFGFFSRERKRSSLAEKKWPRLPLLFLKDRFINRETEKREEVDSEARRTPELWL